MKESMRQSWCLFMRPLLVLFQLNCFLYLIIQSTYALSEAVNFRLTTKNSTLRQISATSAVAPNFVTNSLSRIGSSNKLATETNEELNAAFSERISSDHHSSSSLSNNKLLVSNASNQSQDTNALLYLQRFGYMQAMNAEANNLISEESFSEAISNFQRFAGIPDTGTIDDQTLKLMRMPRCGNVDKVGHLADRNSLIHDKQLFNLTWPQSIMRGIDDQSSSSSSEVKRGRRRKRYALQGSKWRRQELTYRISQYPTKFSAKRYEVDAQIEKAFSIWSQVAPINFVVKKEGRVHIDIRFASGDHGDGDAFDGPGNTLAHAYFPQYGGDAHFDDQEYWTIDSYTGTNIFQVAAHELGHSLGLGHSNVREALMAPFYQKYKPNFKLHVDDILAIQALYGEKPFLSSSSSSSADIPPLPNNDIGLSAFDNNHHRRHHHLPQTTTSMPTTTTTTSTTTTTTTLATVATNFSPTTGPRFLFGSPPIETTSNRFNPFGPPLPLPPINRHHHDFGGGSSQPNDGAGAGAGDHKGAGNNDNGIDIQPPSTDSFEPSSVGGGQIPSHSLPADLCSDSVIDAITRTEDGKSYVFKGDHYWLLTNHGLAEDHPRKISLDWEGLPGSLDAALTWADGKTFFFKGNKYWRFRNKRRDIGYPKLISAGFAGIPDDIDAAFVWSGNGRTYIFKGSEYWRFDSKADPPVSAEYPRTIRVWNGVPFHINAAFRWENNVTYFFKGSQYYRFNDKDFKVETRGKPPFPRSSAEWWFGCVNTNLAQKSLPSNFRESLTEEPNLATGAQQTETDWSYLAGLEDNTRIMGTHISDHKPSFTQPQNGDSDKNVVYTTNNRKGGVGSGGGDGDSETTTLSAGTAGQPKITHQITQSYTPQIFGGRIGFFNPSIRASFSSSAAILNANPNWYLQLVAFVMVLWWRFGSLSSDLISH